MRALETARIVRISQVVIAACMFVIVIMEYVRPYLADYYYQDEYRRLTFECDLAMHDEAALRVGTGGAAKEQTLSVSADIGLTVCHEYDKLRKRMLLLGVSEQKLALHGLEILESEQIPVGRMVQPHRMEHF